LEYYKLHADNLITLEDIFVYNFLEQEAKLLLQSAIVLRTTCIIANMMMPRANHTV